MSSIVVIDARKVADGGIGVYLDNLIDGIASLSRLGQANIDLKLIVPPFSALSSTSCRRAYTAVEKWSRHSECIEDGAAKYSFSEYFLLPRRHQALFKSASVFHSPHITLPFSLDLPTVATIHDALLLTHARTKLRKEIARRMIFSTLKRANSVLTVSSQSKLQLEQLFPTRRGLEIKVIHNAVADRYFHASQDGKTKQFRMMWVGNNKAHKGLSLFLDALEAYRNKFAEISEKLTILCADLSPVLKRRASMLGAELIENVGDDHLQRLYQEARCLVMSSFEEGCGLPAIEAVAQGIPVVSTPIPSIEEMCGQVPYFSKGFSALQLAESIHECLEESEQLSQQRLLRGVEQLKQFSIEAQARKTLEVYDLLQAIGGRTSFILEPNAEVKKLKRSVG